MTTGCIEYATRTSDNQNDTQCYYCEDDLFLYRQEWSTSPVQYKYQCKIPNIDYDEL